jgi:hypothetical protein
MQQNIRASRYVFGRRMLSFIVTEAIDAGDEDHGRWCELRNM